MKSASALAELNDLSPSRDDFRRAVMLGFQQKPKRIPSQYFYDAAGSALFDEICTLPEYYPTRTECAILAEAAPEIAALLGPQLRLIEFGSGAGVKVRLLLAAMAEPALYVPVDISRKALLAAATSLAEIFPKLRITPICADYSQAFTLPGSPRGTLATAGFFPGSTIGNFTPEQAWAFLSQTRRLLGSGAMMIIGVDRKKDPAILNAAYNDAAGVTARFNLNVLARINRELAGDFDLTKFHHVAFYNEAASRIEMHLESQRAQTVHIDGEQFSLAEFERIHTENSYKYTPEEFQDLALRSGFATVRNWSDRQGLFTVYALRAV